MVIDITTESCVLEIEILSNDILNPKYENNLCANVNSHTYRPLIFNQCNSFVCSLFNSLFVFNRFIIFILLFCLFVFFYLRNRRLLDFFLNRSHSCEKLIHFFCGKFGKECYEDCLLFIGVLAIIFLGWCFGLAHFYVTKFDLELCVLCVYVLSH